MPVSPIDHLFFLLSTHGGPDAVCASLRDASTRVFQGPILLEPEALYRLDRALMPFPACRSLLHRRLLLESLLEGELFFPDFLESIQAFPWLFSGGREDLRGLVFPLLFEGGSPRWWMLIRDETLPFVEIPEGLDSAFRGAISEAAVRAGVGRGVRVLALDTEEGVFLQKGASAGLAFFLACHFLAKGLPFPASFAASGVLGEGGGIHPVAGAREKRLRAREAGIRFLLLPELSCDPDFSSQDMLCSGVRNLGEALSFMDGIRNGMGLNGILWQRDGHAFFRDFSRIPLSGLRRMAKDGTLHGHLEAYGREEGNWRRIFGLIRETSMKGKTERALLLRDACLSMEERLPRHLGFQFDFAYSVFFLEVRRGNPESAAFWAGKLLDYKEACGWDEECERLWPLFTNLDWIGKSHDCYRFGEAPPDWVLPLVAGQIQNLSEKKNLQPLAADAHLGALCGTLSQHFGFMGSLEDCRFWAEKSIWAFGGRENRETRANWIRAFHYRVYAACDAGEFEAAEEDLLFVFGAEGLETFEISEKRTSWELALLARYGADAGSPSLKARIKEALWPLALGRKGHPWPLVWHNLGRMARSLGEAERAVLALEESLTLALDPLVGPTIRMMALLPLSELADMGKLGEERALNCLERIRKAIPDAASWGFSIPLDGNLDWLKGFYQRREGVFPFSYR